MESFLGGFASRYAVEPRYIFLGSSDLLLEGPSVPTWKMRRPTVFWTSVLAFLIFVVFLGVVFYKLDTKKNEGNYLDPVDDPPPSVTTMGVFQKAAVVANNEECASIGVNILKKGGKAADAIIATAICDGVLIPQSMGIGGGFLMTLFDSSSKKVYTVNAREMAPGKASEDMFKGNESISQKGGLSIAVPGELKGFWAVYNKFGGGVPWYDLFKETITLCRIGFRVSSALSNTIREKSPGWQNYPNLRKLLTNPITRTYYKTGELMTNQKMAETLEIIGKNGIDVLYNGSLGESLIADIQKAGGIMTEDDLRAYKAEIEEGQVKASLKDDMTIYSVPLPGFGPGLTYIFTLLNGLIPSGDFNADIVKIVEAFKFAFGRRPEFGDPNFIDSARIFHDMADPKKLELIQKKIQSLKTHQDPAYYGANFSSIEDHGTANMAVLAENGDAAVMTSTINLHFGSNIVSESTGIILNDEMDDFSSPDMINYFNLPPSSANYIKPYKRPLSSMCPSIVLDKQRNVRLLVGAAGGSKIPTATALVTMLNLWYNETIKEAIDHRRVHHQLFPMEVSYEVGLKKSVVDAIVEAGHKFVRLTDNNHFGTCSNAIAKNKDVITAAYDARRLGGMAGY